jgi:hypothetical protein
MINAVFTSTFGPSIHTAFSFLYARNFQDTTTLTKTPPKICLAKSNKTAAKSTSKTTTTNPKTHNQIVTESWGDRNNFMLSYGLKPCKYP